MLSLHDALPICPPAWVVRAKAIILTPRSEWQRIAGEDTSTREVTTGYFIPLLLIGTLCGAAGTLIYGGNVFGVGPYATEYHPSLISGVIGAFVAFVLTLISFFFLTIVADLLASTFGAQQDRKSVV